MSPVTQLYHADQGAADRDATLHVPDVSPHHYSHEGMQQMLLMAEIALEDAEPVADVKMDVRGRYAGCPLVLRFSDTGGL